MRKVLEEYIEPLENIDVPDRWMVTSSSRYLSEYCRVGFHNPLEGEDAINVRIYERNGTIVYLVRSGEEEFATRSFDEVEEYILEKTGEETEDSGQ